MDSQHLVSPQEAAAQAQARRMQPSDPMGHHGHHHHSHSGSDDVGAGQQYFNPAAMHSRSMGLDSGGPQQHYGGMQLPPLGQGQSNGGHGGMHHQAHYGSHFGGQSHAMPSQLAYPHHQSNQSHGHMQGGQAPGGMPMYGYGVHHSSPQQHYSHVPGQAAHGGMGGMVAGAGSNPMMGAPGGGNSGGEFGGHTFGQQQHYPQYFQPQNLQSISPSQAGAPPSANHSSGSTLGHGAPASKSKEKAPKAPKVPKVPKPPKAPKAEKVPKVPGEPKMKTSKKGAGADGLKAKDKAHPYAMPGPDGLLPDAKPVKKSKKADEPPKPTALKSRLKPPKQAPSAWQIFFTEELQKIKAESPDERLNVAHVAKDAGQRYAALPDSAKEEFARRSHEAKEQWEKEMSDWKAKLTPEDIRQENLYRSAQRKAGKSRKGNLKDPNAPKKPLSAYFLFLRAIRADPTMTQAVFEGEQETTKQSVLAAAKWRGLSETDKQPYLERAEADKARYERLRREYEQANGIEPSSSKLATDYRSESE